MSKFYIVKLRVHLSATPKWFCSRVPGFGRPCLESVLRLWPTDGTWPLGIEPPSLAYFLIIYSLLVCFDKTVSVVFVGRLHLVPRLAVVPAALGFSNVARPSVLRPPLYVSPTYTVTTFYNV